jgi:hypothetical protein
MVRNSFEPGSNPVRPEVAGPGSAQRVINFVGFQIGWFACILTAARGNGWLGPLVVGVLAALYLATMPRPGRQLRLLLGAALLGFVLDSLLSLSGMLSFQSNPLSDSMAPPWIVAMWVNFSLALRSSMRWLLGRYGLGSLLGALGGPSAYYAGAAAGAAEFLAGTPAVLVTLAVVWALAVPILLFLAREEYF